VTRNFGFLGPVLAKQSPAVLDPNQPILAGGDHKWVGGDLVHDRLRLVLRRHDQDRATASLVRSAGRGGRSRSFAWVSGIAQLVSTAAWPIAILGSVSLGAGLAGPGYRLWHTPAASDVLASDKSTRV
jgi:hypothetical protein